MDTFFKCFGCFYQSFGHLVSSFLFAWVFIGSFYDDCSSWNLFAILKKSASVFPSFCVLLISSNFEIFSVVIMSA